MGALKKFQSKQNQNLQSELEEIHHASSHSDEHSFDNHGSKKAEEGEGPWLVSYADLMTLLMGFFALIASFSKPDAKQFDKVAAASSEYFGGAYEAPYEKVAQSLNYVIRENNLENVVKVEIGPDGVTMTFTGTLFFDSGGFDVKAQAAELLNKLSVAMNKEPKKYNALIEGHTDDTPISHPIIASNWELSGIRASRIAKIFEANGFSKDQLTIVGWGETRPIAENYNSDGTPNVENKTKNRRVVIRVYKDLTTEKKDIQEIITK